MTAIAIIACGGRDFTDREFVFGALDRVARDRSAVTLINGGAPGADTLAAEWARDFGYAVVTFKADWKLLGPQAGHIRNQVMLDALLKLRSSSQIIGVVAFPGGRGTADMKRRATAADVPVFEPIYKAATTVN